MHRFLYVTLPMLKPILSVVMLFSVIFTFADFDIVWVLTRGGPTNLVLFCTWLLMGYFRTIPKEIEACAWSTCHGGNTSTKRGESLMA